MGKIGERIKVDAFLPDTINTFSNSSRATVSSLVRQMKVDKTDIQSLINKIGLFGESTNYTSARIAPLSRLSSEVLIDTFRDSFLKTRRLFSAANAVGTVLSSIIDIFFSDIKKVENDLTKMQAYLDNYEFLSGKDDLYNVNYIEKFDSFSNSYIYEDPSIVLSDRDGISFPSDGNCYIDSTSGYLKIGSSLTKINLINNIRSINIVNNYSTSTSTSTDISKLFNDNKFESWTVTVKSPAIINSGLDSLQTYLNYDYSSIKGAQTQVEISFSSPIEIDCIKIDPNQSNGLSLLQVIIYGSNISSGSSDSLVSEFSENKILNSPRLLNEYAEISFTKVLTDKIILIFNQTNYTKNTISPIYSEIISKGIATYVNKKLQQRRTSFSLYQDMVYWHFLKNSTVKGIRKGFNSTDNFYSYRFPQSKEESFVSVIEKALKEGNSAIEDIETFNEYNVLINYIRSIFAGITFDKKTFENNYYIESNGNSPVTFNAQAGPIFTYGNSNLKDPIYLQFNEPISTGSTKVSSIGSFFSEEKTNQYEYSFSLNAIDFCVSNQANTRLQKACYVSKRLGENNQIIAVKSKVRKNSSNASLSGNHYDLSDSLSYELSVSNSARPSTEEDWIPVVSSEVSRIESEVLFIGSDSKATLRFRAKPGTLTLYRDGIYLNPSSYIYVSTENSVRITDPTLIGLENIFVAAYDLDFSQYDYSQIDLLAKGRFKESIKPYIDSGGQGEKFESTNLDRRVKLSYVPYVNAAYSSQAKYSSSIGTIFPTQYSGYSPVKILLPDLTYAINITNYSSDPDGATFYQSSSPLFIQSGRDIIFDREINGRITVFYEYIPADLRFRVIMRNNIPNLFSSSGIDEIILKLKTINYDPYYDKLRKLDGSRYS
jgi:hypothetical protein